MFSKISCYTCGAILNNRNLLQKQFAQNACADKLTFASSVENGFIYYRFNQGNPTVLFYYYKIVRAPNPLSPKPVRLDLPRFFCLLPRHAEKSIIWFVPWTKDNRRSLGRLRTFAQLLCGLKPCCSFTRLAILP